LSIPSIPSCIVSPYFIHIAFIYVYSHRTGRIPTEKASFHVHNLRNIVLLLSKTFKLFIFLVSYTKVNFTTIKNTDFRSISQYRSITKLFNESFLRKDMVIYCHTDIIVYSFVPKCTQRLAFRLNLECST